MKNLGAGLQKLSLGTEMPEGEVKSANVEVGKAVSVSTARIALYFDSLCVIARDEGDQNVIEFMDTVSELVHMAVKNSPVATTIYESAKQFNQSQKGGMQTVTEAIHVAMKMVRERKKNTGGDQ